jgi:hypothetical protein
MPRIQKTLLAVLFLGGAAVSCTSANSETLLTPPGLRPLGDPAVVVPATYQYPNRDLPLTDCRDSSGRLLEGWSTKIIPTRRFASHQSARVNYRLADLSGSAVFNTPGTARQIRIWPAGTVIVIEMYSGDTALMENGQPVEIAVMVKGEGSGGRNSAPYYPVNWSYAKFTPGGEPSPPPRGVEECHQCHSVAFHLTGDLVFTPFP